MIEELSSLIRPHVESLTVYMDYERRGCYWNTFRAIHSTNLRATPGQPALVMTDDAITVPDWRDRWEKIHSDAKADLYCLFSRQRHLFKPDSIERGYVKKIHPGGFYDHATIYIGQQRLIPSVESWYAKKGRWLPKIAAKSHHPDIMIQEYLIAHERPWVVATPTLFDHRPCKSTLGHDIGPSPCYIGTQA